MNDGADNGWYCFDAELKDVLSSLNLTAGEISFRGSLYSTVEGLYRRRGDTSTFFASLARGVWMQRCRREMRGFLRGNRGGTLLRHPLVAALVPSGQPRGSSAVRHPLVATTHRHPRLLDKWDSLQA